MIEPAFDMTALEAAWHTAKTQAALADVIKEPMLRDILNNAAQALNDAGRYLKTKKTLPIK